MKKTDRIVYRNASIIVLAAALSSCVTVLPSNSTDREAIGDRVQGLLAAYGANDQLGIVGMVDPYVFSFYGSDISEVAHSPAELRRLMDDDFALWHSATFGPPANLDIRISGELATAYLDVPFSAGGAPPVRVRLYTTWHKMKGKWLLTQAASSVPTVGSSAKDLLKR